MDIQTQQPNRRPNPRRRKRSKFQIFKEAYLPFIIILLALILIIVMIIGGASRNKPEQPISTQSTQSTASVPSSNPNEAAQLAAEAADLLARADLMARDYDYAGALELLGSFSGNVADFPELSSKIQEYTDRMNAMVAWTGQQVPNLSFQVLIADPERAFPDSSLGKQYLKNFITIGEFTEILQQLYANGYMLVGLDDLYELKFDENLSREVYVEKTLMLPEGKKPVMLTETQVNYYTYMVDSNADGIPDKDADGFASSLCYADGVFYNEIVHSNGTIATGNYDLVPILESFIAEHPDFSYRGARAVIALTGYDRVLGYRPNSSKLTTEERLAECEALSKVAKALKDRGYDLACFSYGNNYYSEDSALQIQADLEKWEAQVAAWVGLTDIMVYARESDIGNHDVYSGSKFNVLYNAGYRFFMGCSSTPWNQVDNLYVRHDRLMVSGANLKNHPEWFASLFDAATVLDPIRNNYT